MAGVLGGGLIDLHAHWVPGIDDGARTVDEGVAMLRAMKALGFALSTATPHMRPGMFENDKSRIEAAYAAVVAALPSDVPATQLASEHFFDDTVYGRLLAGEAVPYPRPADAPANPRAKRSILVEFSTQGFPVRLDHRLVDLGRKGLRMTVAHPERYRPVWENDSVLDPLLDNGAYLLLDVCALVGKYGAAAEKAARKLLEDEAYEAACTDAHRPADLDECAKAFEALVAAVGAGEARRLFVDGPRRILVAG
jgi:protein-tyrosine phosphatase